MAGGSIKGITIEFNGNTTKLDKALRNIDKEVRSTSKELRNIDRALKFNPTNLDLWKQKQTLLNKKVQETGERLKVLQQAQAKLDADGVDKESAEYMKLQREIIETESKLKHFQSELKKVGNVKLKVLSEQFKQAGEKMTAAGEAMRGLSAAGAATVAALGALAVKSGRTADDINMLSKVTGISTKNLQQYAIAADLVDVSVDAIAKSQKKLIKSMDSARDGSDKQQEAFKKLGVSVTDSQGNLRDSEKVFQDVITALGGIENESDRAALAQTIFGKSAAELNPLIEDQGETYKRVSDTLKKYGLDFVDQETLDKANEFNDQIDTIKVIATAAMSTIGAQLAGYLAPALAKVVDFVGQIAQWLSTLSPEVLTVIGVIGGVLAVLAPILIVVGKLAFAISQITGLMSTLGISFAALAGPVGIAITAIAFLIALGVLLYKNWDKAKAMAAAFKASLVSQFNALKSSITATFNAIKNAITRPIQSAIDKVKAIINKLKGIFPIKVGKIFSGIQLPHFKLTGSFSLKKMTVPHLSVSWYKQGGIFDSPTIAGLGEAGPEAVVPLDKFWSKFDEMTAAMSRVSASGVGTIEIPIYLYPSGPEMGRHVVKTYDKWKKRV